MSEDPRHDRQERNRLHERFVEIEGELEGIIDRLKGLGPDPQDGDNALRNVRERLRQLADR